MELRAYNRDIEPLGIIDEIASLTWRIRYFNNGEFSMLAPVTDNNKELLKNGTILVKHDAYKVLEVDGSKWRRAMEITYMHITKDENGSEQIECKGYTLSKWLNKRIVSQLVMSGTCQQIITALVRQNAGPDATSKRRFEHFEILSQDDYGGQTVEYASDEYTELLSTIARVAVSGKLGFDILVDERNQLYGFYLYKGVDKTSTNSAGNQPCIFSRDFDNVNDQTYEDSTDDVKNFMYIVGPKDEQTGVAPIETIDEGGKSGIDLCEAYSNATDIALSYTDPDGTEHTMTEEEQRKKMVQRGSEELASYVETLNFSSSINMRSNLVYKTDFSLGDVVTCIDKRWGIQIDARISEVAETFEKGRQTIEAVFGESSPTLIDKIKKVR